MPRRRRRKAVTLVLEAGGRVLCVITARGHRAEVVVPAAAAPTPAEREQVADWVRRTLFPRYPHDRVYHDLFGGHAPDARPD